MRVGDEIWVYYSGRSYRHKGYGGGTVLTEPVRLPRGPLWVNAKADWGEVVVEVLDEGGQPLHGATPSAAVQADGVRLPVAWGQGGAPVWPVDQPVRLRFSLRNARLYAWGV